MKLHLPLPLRSALLAVCAFVYVQPTMAACSINELLGHEVPVSTMTSDIVYTAGKAEMYAESYSSDDGSHYHAATPIEDDSATNSVHSFLVRVIHPESGVQKTLEQEAKLILDGNERQFSYTVDIMGDSKTAWIVPYEHGLVQMSNMKDISVSGVSFSNSAGDDMPSHASVSSSFAWQGNWDNALDIVIKDSDSFSFTNSTAASFNGALAGSSYTTSTVSLSGVDTITISGNGVSDDSTTSVLRCCTTSFTGAKLVTFANNLGKVFYESSVEISENEKVDVTGNDIFISSAGHNTIDFAKNGVVRFADNQAGSGAIIDLGSTGSSGHLHFTGNESIIVEGNHSHTFIAASSGCGSEVLFSGNGEIIFRENQDMSGPLLLDRSLTYHTASFVDNNLISFEDNIIKTESSQNGVAKADLSFSDTRTGNSSKLAFVRNEMGGDVRYMFTGGVLSVDKLHGFEVSGNTVNVSEHAFYGIAEKTSFTVPEISICDNSINAAKSSYGLFPVVTFSALENLQVTGNAITSESLQKTLLGDVTFSCASAADGSRIAEVNISKNTMTATSGEFSGTGIGDYYGLHGFTLADNSVIVASGNAYSLIAHSYISDTDSVNLSGNLAQTKDGVARGAALSAFSTGTQVILYNNKDVTLSGNGVVGTSSAMGGALYCHDMYDSSATAGKYVMAGVFIGDNETVTLTGNYAQAASVATTLAYANTTETATRDNEALGGALAVRTGTLRIVGNQTVESRGNYVTDGSNYVLSSAWAQSMSLSALKGGSITFYDSLHTAAGLNIGIDTTTTAYASEPETGQNLGSVIFSGAHAADDLAAIKNAAGAGAVTEAELNASRTYSVGTGVQIYGGKLVVTDAATLRMGVTMTSYTSSIWTNSGYSSGGSYAMMFADLGESVTLEVKNGATVTSKAPILIPHANARILLDGGNIKLVGETGGSYNQYLKISGGATLEVKSPSVIQTGCLSVCGGGHLALQVSETNAQTACLTIKLNEHYSANAFTDVPFAAFGYGEKASFSGDFDGPTVAYLDLSTSGTLSAGTDYVLLSIESPNVVAVESGFWDAEKYVTGISEGDDIYWQETSAGGYELVWTLANDIIYTHRDPATLNWTAASGVWQDSAGADPVLWSGEVEDLNFYHGDAVAFGAAAEVEVSGVVRPESILVSNTEGTVRLHGSGQIASSTKLTKQGAGTLQMDNSNSYTGGTLLKEGTLKVGNSRALGLGGVTLAGGTLDLASLAVSNDVTVSGTAALKGAGAYTGLLTVAGGKLSSDAAVNLASDMQLQAGTVDAELSGQGAVVKTSGGAATLTAANSYTGGTSIAAGTLALGNAAALGTGAVALSGGALDLASLAVSNDVTVSGTAALKGVSHYTGHITVTGGTLSSDGAIQLVNDLQLQAGTVSAALAGANGVVKTGSGVATLSGTNTYTGKTQVQAGTLKLATPVAGDLSVAGAATLQVGTLALANGQQLDLADTAKVQGSLTTAAGATVAVAQNATISGTLKLNGGTLTLHPTDGLLTVGTLTTGTTATLLDLGNLVDYSSGKYDLIAYTSSTAELSQFTLDLPATQQTRTNYSLATTATTLQFVVDGSEASVFWNGATGTWAVGAEGDEWVTEASDKHFFQNDEVTINGGTLELDGELRPGSILVTGDADTTLTDVNDIAGSIVGDISLVKEGSGTLTLDLANAYTGGTSIAAGTVKLTNDAAALGTGAVELNGGALELNGLAVDNAVTVSGDAALNGAGAYAGQLTVEDGTLSSDGAINLASDLQLQAGTVAANLSGSAGVVKTGEGVGTLGGTNSYTGETQVQAGTLELTGSLTGSDIVVADGAELSMQGGSFSDGTLLVETGGSLAGSVSMGDAAELVVQDAQLVTDSLAVEGNTKVTLEGNSSLQVTDKVTVAQNATIDIALDASTLVAGSTQELISAGSIEVEGGASIDSVVSLSGVEDYRTTLTQQDNSLVAQTDSALLQWNNIPDGVWKTQGDASLWQALDGNADTAFHHLDSVVIADAGTVTIEGEVKPTTIAVQGDGDTTLTGGVLGGESAIVKSGSGTLRLESENHSTGGVLVEEGALALGSAAALGSGEVVLASASEAGVTVDFGGYSIDNAVSVSGTATLQNAEGLNNVTLYEDSHTTGGLVLGEGQILTLAAAPRRGRAAVEEEQNYSVSGSNAKLDSLTLSGGTLTLRGVALVVTGTTTIVDGATTTVDLSGWSGLSRDTETVLAELGTVTGSVENLTLAGMGELGRYANLALEDDGTLYIVYNRPEMNPEMAAQMSLNQQRAYVALCAIAEEGQASGELADTAMSVGTANDVDELREQINDVSGEAYATMMSSQLEGNLAHLRRLRAHMGHGDMLAGAKNGLCAYANGFSELADVDADASGLGYRRSEWGADMGVEQELGEGSGIGLAFSVGRASVTPTGGARYHEDSQLLDAYHITQFGMWENRVSVGVGFHEFDLRRSTSTGSIVAARGIDGTSFNFSEELACNIRLAESVTLRPFLAVESTLSNIDAFAESGAGSLSLQGSKQNAWATDVTLGMSFNTAFELMERAPQARFSMHAGVTASVGDTTNNLCLRFAGAPEHAYEQSAADRNRWGVNLGAGVSVPVTRYTSVYATAETTLRGDSSSFDAQLGIRMNF